MKLSPMRYKDYVWPHNPRICEIEQKRKISAVKLASGGFVMQDMGKTYRIIKGEGEFSGESAYDEFKMLEAVFSEGGSGILVHPVWQMIRAHFVTLTLRQEPKSDYVAYAFEFWEDRETENFEEVTEKYAEKSTVSAKKSGRLEYTVKRGDTMWGIAMKYDLTLAKLVEMNPQISDPNIIHVGDVIVVGETI